MIDLLRGSTRGVRAGFSRGLWGSAVSMLVLLAGSSAKAEGNDVRAESTSDPCPCANAIRAKEPERPLIERGYGLETLAFDGGALALFATYAASNGAGGDLLPALSAGSYFAGAPAVHLYHGHIDKALLSLGLRGGLPFAFGIAGGFIAASGERSSLGEPEFGAGLGGLVIGAGVGMVAASVLDATLIANERVPAPLPREAGKISSLAPSVGVLPQGGAMVALRGTIF
jgi:hypothetical protein